MTGPWGNWKFYLESTPSHSYPQDLTLTFKSSHHPLSLWLVCDCEAHSKVLQIFFLHSVAISRTAYCISSTQQHQIAPCPRLSLEGILMFVCLQKDFKHCCGFTNLDSTHFSGHSALRPPKKWVLSRFVKPQQCLKSFWRQTNIKISRDLGTLYVDKSKSTATRSVPPVLPIKKFINSPMDFRFHSIQL